MSRNIYILLVVLTCFVMIPKGNAQTRINRDDVPLSWGSKHTGLGSGGSNYSKKKPNRYGLLSGQYSGIHHMIGVYTDGSYSMLLNSVPSAENLPGGAAMGGGLLYQYQNTEFILNVGLGMRWQQVRNNVMDTTFVWHNTPDSWTNQRDTFRYDLKYEFYGRQDISRNLYIQVPILAGQVFCTMKGTYYYLAGIKLNMAIKGSTRINVTGTTTGEYDRYMGVFHEMDNHGLRKDVPMERIGSSLSLKMDVLASAELGYEWASPEKKGYRLKTKQPQTPDWRLRVGVFMDIGLLNINPKFYQPLLNIPKDWMYDFSEYEFNHIFSSSRTDGCQIHNFFVGVKLTAFIGVKMREKCYICGPYKDERYMDRKPNRKK